MYRKEDGEWTFFTMLEGHVNEVKSVSWSQDSLYLASSSRYVYYLIFTNCLMNFLLIIDFVDYV